MCAYDLPASERRKGERHGEVETERHSVIGCKFRGQFSKDAIGRLPTLEPVAAIAESVGRRNSRQRVQRAPSGVESVIRMAMSKSLVIVESPAKAKTIEKYLGKGFEVLASVGHIMDLPKNDIGVELKNRTFEPTLIVSPGKEKVVGAAEEGGGQGGRDLSGA